MAAEVFDEITDLDHSKIWRTFSHLLLRPGELTAEYWRGRRKRYLGPVNLYLVLFALGLILYSIHQPTATLDIETMAAADRTGAYEKVITDMVKKRGLPREQVVQEVNSRWQSYVSLTQFMGPVGLAFVLRVLFLRQRRFYTEHLIFSLHVAAFSILLNILMWCLYLPVGINFRPFFFVLMGLQVVANLIHCVLAVRRAYRVTTLASVVKGAVAFTVYATLLIFVQAVALVLAIKLLPARNVAGDDARSYRGDLSRLIGVMKKFLPLCGDDGGRDAGRERMCCSMEVKRASRNIFLSSANV